MIHFMKVAREPFEKIVDGRKVMESRLLDEKRKLVAIGDEIEFLRNDDVTMAVRVKVTALYRRDSFGGLFVDFPLEYFGGDSKEFLLDEINQFYSQEEQREYGVIGIYWGPVIRTEQS